MSLLHTARDKVFRIRHAIRNWRPVWFYILNRAPRRQWNNFSIKPDNACAKRVLSDLEKNGIAITNVSELFPEIPLEEFRRFAYATLKNPGIDEEIKAHEAMLEERVRTGAERAGKRKYVKDFIVEPWGSTGNNMLPDLGSPFIKMSLHNRILGIAASYLRLVPQFRAFSLRLTLVSPPGAQEYFSQRWHRDNEDKNLCKMFMYLTDVGDDDDGPLCYIRESHTGACFGNIFPSRPPSSVYPDLGGIEKIIPVSAIQKCFGKAGTVIFADTSGLHKGGYVLSAPRLMYTATYLTKAAVSPIHLAYTGNRASLPPLARLALAR